MNQTLSAPAAGEAIIREESARDFLAREALLDRAFGLNRWRKTCERLREGRLPAPGLAFTAINNGVLVGTLRFWLIEAGEGHDALLLGPIAVSASRRSKGLGGRMIRLGLERARELGHGAVLLVGDAPYYQRFGFSRAGAENLDLPGPVEIARFLALELKPGALAGAQGLVRATGAFAATEAERRLAA
ncbi:N-acetyltransferase [Rhodoblastus acidophilus]|uniref:N-acetyltransferase n=1 Tax=Candidatus Rhodoblastus alkanivorans TaxID=2954117 RepID=A0ABS9Z4Z1_9HYPH|nr:N-acetyltransferase [Candidatus Rhodoblastus alkanivorans]MCI4680666.1 N-acetyltransferase [Candidatus Rhodoblastus alkanivorans]MCI4682536.1 N-acetyltransferase [Candidatus Rhodoblastus alkanivorans]MDI4639842.1 N-acetyltransferase [Rhodoblastus acidophilus]